MIGQGPVCHRCGTPSVQAARYCGGCGADLDVARCASCGGLLDPGARFCGDCGAATPRDEALVRPEDGREQLRVATVLFAFIEGVALLVEEEDPEDVKSILSQVFSLLAEPVGRLGGTVDKVMADSLMAVFGAPAAHGDDPIRAVRAAAAMVAAFESLSAELFAERGVRLSIKIGVNTGRVLMGRFGGRDERDLTVLGDAVNLAARLEHAAPPGGVLISDNTRRLVGDRFRLKARPPLSVKGKAEAYRVWEVVGLADERHHRSETLAPVPLVGRERELDLLVGLWREVEEARCVRWVTLTGELGVGKHRLLEELLRVVRQGTPEARVLELRGFPGQGAERVDLVEALVEALGPVSPAEEAGGEWRDLWVAAREGGTGVGEGEARGGRARVGGMGAMGLAPLVHLVAHLASERPVLIAVSALHEADDRSLDFLEALATELPEAPVMILTLARPEVLFTRRPRWGAESERHRAVRVGPLSLAEARTLLGRLLSATGVAPGWRMPPEWVDHLHTFTGGNPYYLVETVRALDEQDLLGAEGDGEPAGALPVPESIEAVIQSRIDRLSFEDGLTLRVAAVVGPSFWLEALSAILGSDRRASLERLEERGFVSRLVPGGLPGVTGYRFTHRLLAQVAYDNLLGPVRRRYHRAFADWLGARLSADGRSHAVLLAGHQERAGLGEGAARTWLVACDEALAAHRYTEARDFAERARGCLPPNPFDALLPAAVGEALGQALRGVGRLGEARVEVAGAVGIYVAQGARSDAARAVLRLGWLDLLLGDFDGVEASLARIEGLVEEGWTPAVGAEALHLRAELDLFRGRLDPLPDLLGRAERIRRRLGDERGLAAVLNTRGKYHDRRSELNLARRAFKEAAQLRERVGDLPGFASSLNNLGSVLEALGELTEAEACHTRSLQVRRGLGDRWGIGATLINQASVLTRRGYLGRARARLAKAAKLFEELGSRWGEALTQGEMARLLLHTGAPAEGAEAARAALDLALEMGDNVVEGELRGRLGRCLADLGRLDEAGGELERALALGLKGQNAELEAQGQLGLAQLALRRGDLLLARDHVEELEWNSAVEVSPWLQTRVALVSGEIALAQDASARASARFSEAARLAADHDLWPLLWHAREGEVRAWHDAGARQLGERGELLGRAREVLAELTARIEDADLVAHLHHAPSVLRFFGALRGASTAEPDHHQP